MMKRNLNPRILGQADDERPVASGEGEANASNSDASLNLGKVQPRPVMLSFLASHIALSPIENLSLESISKLMEAKTACLNAKMKQFTGRDHG